jgi:hypothetical protein
MQIDVVSKRITFFTLLTLENDDVINIKSRIYQYY